MLNLVINAFKFRSYPDLHNKKVSETENNEMELVENGKCVEIKHKTTKIKFVPIIWLKNSYNGWKMYFQHPVR